MKAISSSSFRAPLPHGGCCCCCCAPLAHDAPGPPVLSTVVPDAPGARRCARRRSVGCGCRSPPEPEPETARRRGRPAENAFPPQLFLCLFRACHGKMIIISIKWRKQGVSLPGCAPAHLPSASFQPPQRWHCAARPLRLLLETKQTVSSIAG